MNTVKVKVINKSGYDLPAYATPKSSGCDIRAVINEPIVIPPHSRYFFHTRLSFQLPEGWEIQIRPRSGLAKKYGVVTVLGTLDNDYRGEMGVILFNLSDESMVVNPGERIAQAVIAQVTQIEWEEVDSIDETERGEGGFGSSGRR